MNTANDLAVVNVWHAMICNNTANTANDLAVVSVWPADMIMGPLQPTNKLTDISIITNLYICACTEFFIFAILIQLLLL